MRKINNVKTIYRAYINYVDNKTDEAYDDMRFYVAEHNDRLQKVVEDIYFELKNDFSKYDFVEFEIEKMVGQYVAEQDMVMGKCADQTWEDVMIEFNTLPKKL